MTNYIPLRKCISNSDDELVIFGADNFAQFPRRDAPIRSSCDRALPCASRNDLVVLRGKLDHDYYKWLRLYGLGPDNVVEYMESSKDFSLSECIIRDPEPILKIVRETGRSPIYVPWYSGKDETAAAKTLGAELFGATEVTTRKYNDKSDFKAICQQLDIPVVVGDSFAICPDDSNNAIDMFRIINNHLSTHETVIVRGTVGESGMSLYKTTGNDLPELYELIASSGEKMVLIEPFLRVISSPGDQWVIQRNGDIGHLGVTDQICERGMVHIGTQQGPPISQRLHKYITQTSHKIVKHMLKFGYTGVLGIDYIVTDEAVFPVENNARFNGSTYTRLIIDNLKKITPAIDYWKFIKIKTQPCSFLELTDRIQSILYDGEKINSIFPYNCGSLSSTGDFAVILLAEDLNHLVYLEKLLNERGIKRN